MARHVPHLLVPRPWEGERIEVDLAAAHHMSIAMRVKGPVAVSYTDGAGRVGEGVYDDGVVTRANERQVPPETPEVTIAVAPPKSKDRARFLVEKLTELGVMRLLWLETAHGEGRPPRPAKATAWMRAALEQSRGAYRMVIEGPVSLGAVDAFGTVLYAGQDGAAPADVQLGSRTVLCVGPEGGFAPHEIPVDATVVRLASRVLRVETAAVAGAVLLRER